MTMVEERKSQPLLNAAEAVLNSLPHPVIVIAPDGRIADGNVAAEHFFESSILLLDRHAHVQRLMAAALKL